MLGIGRPRLRARPSLFELITKKDIEELSSSSSRLESKRSFPELIDDVDELPPLPLSPAKPPSSPRLQLHLPSLEQAPTTPEGDLSLSITPHPSKENQKENQKTTMGPTKKVRGGLEEGETGGGAIFSVSGPVIIAEKMTGCAMYELVRQ